MKNLAIFASGGGSIAQALFDHFADSPTARVAALVTNNRNAGAAERAAAAGVVSVWLQPKQLNDAAFLLRHLARYKIDGVLLAGYVKKLPAKFCAAYENRILNTHSALLPKYGGKGMYGLRVHEAVLAAAEPQTGCTFHYVNEVYDSGEIIAQEKISVPASCSAEELQELVKEVERARYPQVAEEVVKTW